MTPEQRTKIIELNSALEPINREYALRRILFDNANSRTHEAQKILKKMMFVGPVAHGLELLELGTLAKIFSSSADDLMGEYAEIEALLGSGFSWQQIIQRLKIGVPVFGIATLEAFLAEHLVNTGHPEVAGAIYGHSASALSLTTSTQSIFMYKECYEQLLLEGKIDDKQAVLLAQPEFKQMWEEFEHSLEGMTTEKMLDLIKSTLEKIPEAILNATDKEEILRQLPKDYKITKNYFEQLKKSKTFEAWKKAIKQDFQNPARLGIFIGSLLGPVGGIAAGSLGVMSNGFVLAGIGSIESIVGGLTVMIARQLNEYAYKASLQSRLTKLSTPSLSY